MIDNEMIVAPQYRKTKAEMDNILDNVDENNITAEILLMLDYAYHNTDEDYGDGLSFLDRLHWKLSLYFQINWNMNNLKDTIRNSNQPCNTFVNILNEILTQEMLACYGV